MSRPVDFDRAISQAEHLLAAVDEQGPDELARMLFPTESAFLALCKDVASLPITPKDLEIPPRPLRRITSLGDIGRSIAHYGPTNLGYCRNHFAEQLSPVTGVPALSICFALRQQGLFNGLKGHHAWIWSPKDDALMALLDRRVPAEGYRIPAHCRHAVQIRSDFVQKDSLLKALQRFAPCVAYLDRHDGRGTKSRFEVYVQGFLLLDDLINDLPQWAQ